MSSVCPSCGESTLAGASFCEACGHELGDQPAVATGTPSGSSAAHSSCVDCGADAAEIVDGYCLVCGHKQPGPRDHLAIDLGWVAGVTDKGRRHHQNEDAMAVTALARAAVAVVCDGVSTTDNPEIASQAAADAAQAVLVEAVDAGRNLTEAMGQAVEAAQAAVVEVPPAAATEGSPSCTFVAAVLAASGHGGLADLTVGWLGDSRAYWLGAADELLTIDHNWATDMVASELLGPDEAAADPRAGTITRWLGRDAPTIEPGIVTRRVDALGTLVLCSDGLWNYASEPDELRVLPALGEATSLARAEALVAFANEAGGHDNITVVIAGMGEAELGGAVGPMAEPGPGAS